MIHSQCITVIHSSKKMNHWLSSLGRHYCCITRKTVTENAISYLYIGKNNVPFTVQPNLDFRNRFNNLQQLKSMIASRNIDLKMDVEILASEYAKLIPYLQSDLELDSLRDQLKLAPEGLSADALKAKIKSVKSKMKSSEADAQVDTILLQCLKLPNEISRDTPIGCDSKLIDKIDRPINCNHSQFLIDNKYLKKLYHPDRLYMTGMAVDVYNRIEEFVRLYFNASGYRLISPPHFVRSSILEGIECDIVSLNLLDESEWALNLVGHNLSAYLALFVDKQLSVKNQFPLFFYSSGMHYNRLRDNIDMNENRILIDHYQRPVITLFALATSEEQLTHSENQIRDNLDKVLKCFDINLKRYLVASKCLQPSEMRRIDWTSEIHLKDEIKLAYLAKYGSFLSERLRCTYTNKNNSWDYLHCCYAQIDLYGLLAASLERYCDKKGQVDGLNLFLSVLEKNLLNFLSVKHLV